MKKFRDLLHVLAQKGGGPYYPEEVSLWVFSKVLSGPKRETFRRDRFRDAWSDFDWRVPSPPGAIPLVALPKEPSPRVTIGVAQGLPGVPKK